VQARLIGADGALIGPSEFQVNTYTTGNQEWPSVAADPDGNFVIVWSSEGSFLSDNDSLSVQARRFRSDGTPLDPVEFQVNTYTTGYQAGQSVAALPEGGFVVVWTSYGSWGSDTSYKSVQARRFGAGGVPLDPVEFQVNTYTLYDQRAPQIAAAPDGRFLVVWQSDGSLGSDQSGTSIQARRFAPDGTPIDPVEFQVNTYTLSDQHGPVLAMTPTGSFIIAWTSDLTNGTDTHIGVQARRFAANGDPLDPEEFQANVFTDGAQSVSGVAASAAGDFVVGWDSLASAGDDQDFSAQARRFRSDGTPVDSLEFQLNTYTTSWQFGPVLAGTPDGDFIAVWPSYGSYGTDSSGSSVQARRFGRPTIDVTTTSGGTGGPDCTLRDAVSAANSGAPVGACPPGNEGAVISLPPGATITLTAADNGVNALPRVVRPVTIAGHGAQIERDPGLACPAAPEFRLFEVPDGGILTLDDVAVSNGCVTPGAGGGVLASGGTVVLREALIEGNEAESDGGGVAVVGGNLLAYDSTVRANLSSGAGGGVSISEARGWLLLERSTLAENTSVTGGGLSVSSTVPALVRNSTISGNQATGSGGGIELSGASPSLTLDFSTVADNAAPSGAGAMVDSGVLSINGSLVGEGGGGADCAAGLGSVVAAGANLDTDGSCAALAGGAVATVASFDLGPLEWNGGPTWTRAPRFGSPALDVAPTCTTFSGATIWNDQRGHIRPTDDDGDLDPKCDLGAVELGYLFVDGFESGDTRNWSLAVP
jgi:hypothetical protein